MKFLELPNTVEIRKVLEQVLAQRNLTGLAIVGLERQPSAYRSSFPLEEIRISLNNGSVLEVVCKNESRRTLSEAVQRVKPDFLYDPLREIEVYRRLLAPYQSQLGTAEFYGALTDVERDCYLLFLEQIHGEELYKVGEFSTWKSCAEWLAAMHQKLAQHATVSASQSKHLLKFDAGYFRLWMQRAQQFSEDSLGARFKGARREIARIAKGYEEVVRRLVALPYTFIHGEFYASNIMIVSEDYGLRICPIDWEMAAVGPGLIDLAALVSGRWTENQRMEMAMAYRDSLTEHNVVAPLQPETFLSAIDDCRLHLAIQWLGWSSNWSPPPDHAHDWLNEAMMLAEKTMCL